MPGSQVSGRRNRADSFRVRLVLCVIRAGATNLARARRVNGRTVVR